MHIVPQTGAELAPVHSEVCGFEDQQDSSDFSSSQSGLDGKARNGVIVRYSERVAPKASLWKDSELGPPVPKPSLKINVMNRTVFSIALAITGIFLICFSRTASAQPSFPWPPGGGRGGTNTNTLPNLPPSPPYAAPGLKVMIPEIENTNFTINLLEADPDGTYSIFFGQDLTSGNWTNVADGVVGQTSFSVAIPTNSMGFYRVARMDPPVTSAAAISVYFPDAVVRTNIISAFVEGGPAASMAITTDCTAISNAVWMPFSSVPAVIIGTNEGIHEICFGFKGEDGVEFWSKASVVLDLAPPLVVITNPVGTSTERPYIQIHGHANERLSRVEFDVFNSNGGLTNEPGYVLTQFFDTNLFQFTTNWFQCFDVGLAIGSNNLTLRVTDLAGNTTSTNFSYILDPSSDTNPPSPALIWPQSGNQIAGSNITLRGMLDDETSQIFAQLIGSDGSTNLVEGLVERNGRFWFEELALPNETNNLVLIATDFAGNVFSTNLTFIKASVELAFDSFDETLLHQNTVSLSGNINDPSFQITVNGVVAAVDANGGWVAENVPTLGSGTVTFDAVATDGEITVHQSLAREVPPFVYISKYYDSWGEYFPGEEAGWDFTKTYEAKVDDQNRHSFHGSLVNDGLDGGEGYMWWKESYVWSDTNVTGVTSWSRGEIGTPAYDESGTNIGMGMHMLFANAVPTTSLQTWDPFVVISHFFAELDYRFFGGGHAYLRKARTEMKIRTGGKTGLAKRNLFRINAASTRYGQPASIVWGNQPDNWVSTPMNEIDPKSIRVLGRNLGSDGNLFITLPDNEELDLGAFAPGRHYSMNVSATKHKLRIIANGVPLQPERIVSAAKFCVGQKISLTSLFTPAVNDNHEKTIKWVLAPQFINAFEVWKAPWADPEPIWDESYYDLAWGLTHFRVDQYWLGQEQTRAWWLTGNTNYETKPISLGMHLSFTNGQQVIVTAKGLLGMHQPSITWDAASYQPGVVHGRISVYSISNFVDYSALQVRVGAYDSEDERLIVGVKSDSLFPGQLGCTQLLIRDSLFESFSNWRLDNSFPYSSIGYLFPPNGSYGKAAYTFGDGPTCPVGGYMHDQFKQYFQFRPDTAGSIWVTLGTAEWEWRGEITHSTNAPSGWEWVTSPYCTHSQAIQPSSSHPEWLQRKINF